MTFSQNHCRGNPALESVGQAAVGTAVGLIGVCVDRFSNADCVCIPGPSIQQDECSGLKRLPCDTRQAQKTYKESAVSSFNKCFIYSFVLCVMM